MLLDYFLSPIAAKIVVPPIAARIAATKIANLAKFNVIASENAKDAMKIDMVKPMPASIPTPSSSRGCASPGILIPKSL